MQQRRPAASSERCHGQGAGRADVPSDVAARALVPSLAIEGYTGTAYVGKSRVVVELELLGVTLGLYSLCRWD